MMKLQTTALQLNQLNPKYFSVTYGAAGSTQDRTIETVSRLRTITHTITAPHISCIGATKQKITQLLNRYRNEGICHLIVLRGDLPSNAMCNTGDFHYASDLVQYIRATTGNHFYIEVAAYPEFHPETSDANLGLYYFKEKVTAGANSALTQYFYNADSYFRFIEACAQSQINIPIIPGIMPIINYKQLARFSAMCGAEIPRWLHYRLESFGNDIESLKKFGIDVVTTLCQQLLNGGAPGLHFYTLNKSEASLAILDNLNLYGKVEPYESRIYTLSSH